MTLLPTKRCAGCGFAVPISGFHRRKCAKDGLQSRCKACMRTSARRFREASPERHRERVRQTIERLRERVINGYGGGCTCCGESTRRFLTIDHVENDGTAHRALTGAGYAIWRAALKEHFPERYTISCFNCNMGRASNGGVCPHKEQEEEKAA